ncbi:MAG TPA: EAL domain-containing protein [Acetobacteraceae bacterium]|nr:EAL domain-containing protein [Acetobacteraceae bacterium]
MPQIIIERAEGSLADRFRSYKVIIDGQYRGNIRQKEKWSFEVAAGSHTVSFRIDYYCSPALKVVVANRTRLLCKSSLAHALGMLAVFSPTSWITLHEEDEAAADEAPYPGDVNWQQLAKETASQPAPGAKSKKVLPGALRLSDHKMDEATRARRTLELDLREAVTAGALEIRYEPQVDLGTKRVVAFEALLRWRHPVLGKVPAADFVPMAENLGLIGAIGKQVLDAACHEAASWPEDVSVAVNVSPGQIKDGALGAIVAAALQSSGIAPHRLILEVAEFIGMKADGAQAAELQALRQIGVRIGINDFGVIPSSLRRNAEGAFDVVKISRLLVSGLSQSNDRLATVREVINFCAVRRVPCCAVGVESREDLTLLTDEQCAMAQGQFFGPALAAREIPGLLARMNGVGIGGGGAQPEAPFMEITEMANDVVIVMTAPTETDDSRITYVNPAFTRLTGYAAAEALGVHATMLYSRQTRGETLESLRATLSEGHAAQERVLFQTKSGAPYWLDMRVAPHRDASGQISHFIAIARETTSNRSCPVEADTAGERDEVTGVFTRAALGRAIAAELESGEDIGPCVAIIRAAGAIAGLEPATADAVLFAIAGRLSGRIRRIDLIGRAGPADFAVLMPGVDRGTAKLLAECLARAVAARPIDTEHGEIAARVTASVAAANGDDTPITLLLRAAAAQSQTVQEELAA